jgi:hypothetical protein
MTGIMRINHVHKQVSALQHKHKLFNSNKQFYFWHFYVNGIVQPSLKIDRQIGTPILTEKHIDLKFCIHKSIKSTVCWLKKSIWRKRNENPVVKSMEGDSVPDCFHYNSPHFRELRQ